MERGVLPIGDWSISITLSIFSSPLISLNGSGTTFDIFLPVTEKEVAHKAPTDKAHIQGSGTVLLVDDEELILEVGGAMVEKLGYNVIIAQGGEQAVEIVASQGDRIALVILDLIMPGIEGGKTFELIREMQPSIPVLLSSGYSLNGHANDIMQKGCNGFIQKPFSIAELSQKISTILNTAD